MGTTNAFCLPHGGFLPTSLSSDSVSSPFGDCRGVTGQRRAQIRGNAGTLRGSTPSSAPDFATHLGRVADDSKDFSCNINVSYHFVSHIYVSYAMNPFRFDRLPSATSFFDREKEVDEIVKAIKDGMNLLVYGPRRMGKTSCLLKAARIAADKHGAVSFFVDLSLYATLADVTEALLKSATPALGSLGSRTALILAETVKGLVLKPKAKASVDGGGSGAPSIDIEIGLELRSRDSAAHSKALIDVLDKIDELAGKNRKKVAVILDEFTFLELIGPERVSWQLRGAMQKHQHVVYILAGSVQHVIDQLHGDQGPFMGMFGRLLIGPIPHDPMSEWIDASLEKCAIRSEGAGAQCILLVGPRTRDIIQLARRTFDEAKAKGAAKPSTVRAALASIVDDFSEEYWRLWSPLSSISKSILQAVASGHGLTLFHRDTLLRYGLVSTAAVSQACRTLEQNRAGSSGYRPPILARIEHATGREYVFDNPFFKVWVQRLLQS